jgi:hypothetical protein
VDDRRVRITSVAEIDDGATPGTVITPEATAENIRALDWLRPGSPTTPPLRVTDLCQK